MVVSHSHQFIFVKTAKTAGTSVETYLSSLCDDGDVFTPIFPKMDGHVARNYLVGQDPDDPFFIQSGELRNHIPARKLRWYVRPKVWNSYFKFCVERNPWDKTLSHYHMVRHRNPSMTFEKYLAEGTLCHNFFRYTDRNDNLIVDQVLRYESLNAELADVFEQLGVPFSGELTVRAKSEYRTDRRHYREVLTDAQRDLIAERFQNEIEMFGYEF